MYTGEDIRQHNNTINNNILKSFGVDIEKAKSGVYEDTPENRKLGRVGQKYGSEKKEISTITQEQAISKYENIVKLITKNFNKKGIQISNISKSNTDVGRSWYIIGKYKNQEWKIRISDHSVGTNRYTNDNVLQYIYYNENEDSIKNKINNAIEMYNKIKTSEDKKDELFEKNKNQLDNYANKFKEEQDSFKNLRFHIMENTYQDLDIFKQKKHNATNIIRTKNKQGGYRYEWTEPKDNGYGNEKPSAIWLRERYGD